MHILNNQILVSKGVKKHIESLPGDKMRQVKQQLLQLSSRLLSWDGRYDGNLMHETDFSRLKELNLKYHLYKGKSNWGCVFRCAWLYDRARFTLKINQIWTDHDLYEKEAAVGKGLMEGGADINITKTIME